MVRVICTTLVASVLAFAAQPALAQESKAAQATRKKLTQKISVTFKETRTADVFNEIKIEMDKPVNIKIDNVSGVSNNSKLTYSAKGKTVEQILNDVCDKLECGWIVVSNAANNKVDGWIIIRKSTKGKERGYEAGKEPAKGKEKSSLDLPRIEQAAAIIESRIVRIERQDIIEN